MSGLETLSLFVWNKKEGVAQICALGLQRLVFEFLALNYNDITVWHVIRGLIPLEWLFPFLWRDKSLISSAVEKQITSFCSHTHSLLISKNVLLILAF